MSRAPVFPVVEKVRIVLPILAGEANTLPAGPPSYQGLPPCVRGGRSHSSREGGHDQP
jgi:hypothetical protein